MNYILPPDFHNTHHSEHPPKAWREFYALAGTALNAEQFPILARHWPGVIAIGGGLAINDSCQAHLHMGVRYE